jgi:hypothetical protein
MILKGECQGRFRWLRRPGWGFADLIKAGIINPAKVVRVALQDAAGSAAHWTNCVTRRLFEARERSLNS